MNTELLKRILLYIDEHIHEKISLMLLRLESEADKQRCQF